MEKLLLKLFDFNKIPTKLIFVVWVTCGLALFLPANLITKLNIQDFNVQYGKYLGITFIICTAFLLVSLTTHFSFLINRKKYRKAQRETIKNAIENLDYHEKALLREFFINGKNALQLPIDNDTVTGLTKKCIIYSLSNTGFTYIHGAYFTYSITDYASELLTTDIIDLPSHPSDSEKQRILENRPKWAIDKSRFDNL